MRILYRRTQALKKQRAEEAAVRKAAYDALTTEQKLARLDAGGFKATKERLKLQTPTWPGPKEK